MLSSLAPALSTPHISIAPLLKPAGTPLTHTHTNKNQKESVDSVFLDDILKFSKREDIWTLKSRGLWVRLLVGSPSSLLDFVLCAYSTQSVLTKLTNASLPPLHLYTGMYL